MINKSTGEILQRNWSLIEKGTCMTQDFAAFLKKLADTKAFSCKAIAGFMGLMGKVETIQEKF